MQYHQQMKESPGKKEGRTKDNEMHVLSTLEAGGGVFTKSVKAEIENLKEARKTRIQRSMDREVDKIKQFLK